MSLEAVLQWNSSEMNCFIIIKKVFSSYIFYKSQWINSIKFN